MRIVAGVRSYPICGGSRTDAIHANQVASPQLLRLRSICPMPNANQARANGPTPRPRSRPNAILAWDRPLCRHFVRPRTGGLRGGKALQIASASQVGPTQIARVMSRSGRWSFCRKSMCSNRLASDDRQCAWSGTRIAVTGKVVKSAPILRDRPTHTFGYASRLWQRDCV